MSKIGILTMHRPVNYGSALQAWATQKIIDGMGFQSELIDYIYPNKGHKKRRSLIAKIKYFSVQAIMGFPWARKTEKFRQFWSKNYRLSKEYPNKQCIMDNCPEYDIYIVGSDQVWNPNMIKGDSTFLLDFVPDEKKKISLSSSFSVDALPEKFKPLYKEYLSRFYRISVRENNGGVLVKRLINRDVAITLDPTLMLTPNSYESLISQSKLRIDKPYILVYILKYAFNPYPYATSFIREIYRQTELKVVCIDFSHSQKTGIDNLVHLGDAISPQDFVWLFKHASVVITNSFHGAAFAVNFGKSLYVIGNPDSGDDRVKSLLSEVGMSDRIFFNGDNFPKFDLKPLDENVGNKLDELRERSKDYLLKALDI